MKKYIGRFLTVLFLLLTVTAASFAVSAKELEECYHCNRTGKYQCGTCHNTGTVVCDGCGGKVKSVCPGESGKGKCNKGYYTCPSCNGDGKCRTGDGEITEGSCGNCGGSGKKECWNCHGAGEIICDRCGGKGKCECQIGDCKLAKKIGWKCPYCNGAGYLLVGNPMPPAARNDGVQNVPVKGDYIVTNNHSWAGYTYGGGTANAGGETTSSRASDKQDSAVESSANDTTETKTPAPEMTLLPENRNTDFDIAVGEPTASSQAAVALRVETGKMSAQEQRYYAGLSEETLAQVLTNVKAIVASSTPGKAEPETYELLQKLAAQNGYENPQEGKIFPLYFEGHQEIGFPVRVTVSLEKGALSGGSDIYVYHIAQSGEIELMGKAEYGTYEDGSVESLSFYTSSFSTFFTADKEIATELPSVDENDSASKDGGKQPGFPIGNLIAVAAVLVAAGVIVAVVLKKKKAGR